MFARTIFGLFVFLASAPAFAQEFDPVKAQRQYALIVATSTERRDLQCTEIDGLPLASQLARDIGMTAADCSARGTVNSGSGLGVAFYIDYANRPVSSVTFTRAGISFVYPGGSNVHSELSGACFSAVFTARVDFADGSTCTLQSMGNPPHSACTETALNNSAAPRHAAKYSELLAPGAIAAVFYQGLTNQTASAGSLPLPERLADVEAWVFLNTPRQRKLKLVHVSPTQANVILPDDLASGGLATLQMVNVPQDYLRPGYFNSNAVEPGIFTTDSTGNGTAAGYYDQGHVVLFGTGFNTGKAGYLLVGVTRYPANFIGKAPGFVGLWQANTPNHPPRGSRAIFCVEDRCSQVFGLP